MVEKKSAERSLAINWTIFKRDEQDPSTIPEIDFPFSSLLRKTPTFNFIQKKMQFHPQPQSHLSSLL